MSWKQSILALVLALMVTFLVPLFLFQFCTSTLVLSTILELLLLAVALIVSKRGLSWGEVVGWIGFRRTGAGWFASSILMGVFMWILAVFLQVVITLFFPYPPELVEAQSAIFAQTSILDSLLWTLQVILIGFCEEALFRGVIQRGFEESFPAWAAILITGFLFGAIHLDIRGLLPRMLLGVVYGYAYVRSDHNITVPSIAHTVNDLIAIVLLPLVLQ
jgi:membrane protease YdiL (CAAX protease family)